MTLAKFEQTESTSQNTQAGEHTHHLYHQVNQLRACGHENHGGHGHANKADAHLPAFDIVGDTGKAATKAIAGATHAAEGGASRLLNASGEEANHLWSEMDKNPITSFYKHTMCLDNPVLGALEAPAAIATAVFFGTQSAAAAGATALFTGAMGALGAADDYGNRQHS